MKEYYIKDIINDFKMRHQGSKLSFGASSLLLFREGILFALVKPKNWRVDASGLMLIDYSGIGGGIEEGENPFQCVIREINEEISIKENDLLFCEKSFDTIYITDDAKKSIVLKDKDTKMKPLIIFEHKVEPHYSGKNDSAPGYLLLFIYLAKIRKKGLPKISDNEEIPGLIYIRGTFLRRFLRKSKICNIDSNCEIYIRKKYKRYLPEVYSIMPKFTPLGLQKSSLQYKDMIHYLGNNKNIH